MHRRCIQLVLFTTKRSHALESFGLAFPMLPVSLHHLFILSCPLVHYVGVDHIRNGPTAACTCLQCIAVIKRVVAGGCISNRLTTHRQ